MELRRKTISPRVPDILRDYLMEVNFLKRYFSTILITLLLCFSLYLFMDEASMAWIGDEDNFFEWMTSLCFLASAVLCFMFFARKRNIFFLLLAIVFFVGFGEEISWGQRVFGYSTPESLVEINAQKEFNFHNTMTWEINFIFKVFTLAFGIALPFLVYHFKAISRLTARLRMPVPPISLGIFFMADWLVFKFTVTVLPQGYTPKYYFAATEIYEFITSFILVSIFYFFFINRNKMIQGVDIKDQLNLETETRETYITPSAGESHATATPNVPTHKADTLR